MAGKHKGYGPPIPKQFYVSVQGLFSCKSDCSHCVRLAGEFTIEINLKIPLKPVNICQVDWKTLCL